MAPNDCTTSTPPAMPPMYRRVITFDRITQDYALYLDDEIVGYARTYHEGEVTLDALVYELQQHEQHSLDYAGHTFAHSVSAGA